MADSVAELHAQAVFRGSTAHDFYLLVLNEKRSIKQEEAFVAELYEQTVLRGSTAYNFYRVRLLRHRDDLPYADKHVRNFSIKSLGWTGFAKISNVRPCFSASFDRFPVAA